MAKAHVLTKNDLSCVKWGWLIIGRWTRKGERMKEREREKNRETMIMTYHKKRDPYLAVSSRLKCLSVVIVILWMLCL